MIRDNAFLLTTKYPPEDDQKAIERVAEFGGACLTNLVDMAFLDIRQLRVALSECGYSLQVKTLLGKGRVKTHKALAIGRDGTEYTMFLSEMGSWYLRIDNAAMTKAGTNVDPQSLKLMEELEDAE